MATASLSPQALARRLAACCFIIALCIRLAAPPRHLVLPRVAGPPQCQGRILRKASETGDAPTQVLEGVFVQQGPTPEQAAAASRVQRIEEAAKAGNREAKYRLARMLRAGKELPRDLPRAQELFVEAAKQGHTNSHYYAGLMLCEGDEEEHGLWYFHKASKAGIAQAQYQLGVRLYDFAKAEVKEAGTEDEYHEDDEDDDTFERIRKKMGMAAYWLKEAADQGVTEAQFQVAMMLLHEECIVQNATMAADYFLQATASGHVDAMEAVSHLYRTGEGVEVDLGKAHKLLVKAGNGGSAWACYSLGTTYRKGDEFVERDAEAAVRWFTKAAGLGHAEAAEELGVMHLTGEGTVLNEVKAMQWLQEAERLKSEAETE